MNSVIISSLFLLSSIAFGQEIDRLDTVVSNAYDDLVDSTNSHVEELVAPRELLFKKKRSYGHTYSKKAPAVRPVYSKKAPAPVFSKKAPAPVFSKKAPAVYKKAPNPVYAKKAPAPVYSKKGRYLGEEDEADARELLFKKKLSYGPTYSKKAPAVRPVYSKKAPAPVFSKKAPVPVYFQKGRYLGEEDEADARELLFKKTRSYGLTYSKKAPAVRPVYSKKAPAPVFSKKAPAPVFSKKAPAPVFSKKAPAPVFSKKAPAPVFSKKAPAVYSQKGRYLGEEDEADARELLFKKKRSYGLTYSKKAPALRPVYSKKAPAPDFSKKASAPVYFQKGRYLGEEDEVDARELLFKKKRSHGLTYSKKAPALRPAYSKKAPSRPVYTKKAPVYSKGRFY